MYPQAVYFPIRTLYLTLKIEQRERYKSGMSWLGWLAGLQRAVGYPRSPLRQALSSYSSLLHVVSLLFGQGQRTKPNG